MVRDRAQMFYLLAGCREHHDLSRTTVLEVHRFTPADAAVARETVQLFTDDFRLHTIPDRCDGRKTCRLGHSRRQPIELRQLLHDKSQSFGRRGMLLENDTSWIHFLKQNVICPE